MKNRILQVVLLVFFLFSTSCSEDDGSVDPIEPQEKVLSEIFTSHFNDGNEFKRTEEFFLSGKQYLKYTYEGSTLIAKAEYKYNSRGLVERIKYFYNDTFEEQGIFTYDVQGRLIEFFSENISAPEMAYYREFEYPFNATIIEQQKDYLKDPLPGGMFVYSLNETNLITKIESEDGEIYEAEYDGYQITSVSTPFKIDYNYSYDEINLDQGDFYKKYFQSIYGEDSNNAALYLSSLLDIPMVYADKYLLTTTWDAMTLRSNYVLDDEGFPLGRDSYDNDVLISRTSYKYE